MSKKLTLPRWQVLGYLALLLCLGILVGALHLGRLLGLMVMTPFVAFAVIVGLRNTEDRPGG